MDCIFCKIINGILQKEIIYEDQWVIAFDDIFPQAPLHQLIIPRKHISNLNEIEKSDAHLISHLAMTGKQLAEKAGLSESGYRLVLNCNQDGGQTVFHIHMHLLAGRPMEWPPG